MARPCSTKTTAKPNRRSRRCGTVLHTLTFHQQYWLVDSCTSHCHNLTSSHSEPKHSQSSTTNRLSRLGGEHPTLIGLYSTQCQAHDGPEVYTRLGSCTIFSNAMHSYGIVQEDLSTLTARRHTVAHHLTHNHPIVTHHKMI